VIRVEDEHRVIGCWQLGVDFDNLGSGDDELKAANFCDGLDQIASFEHVETQEWISEDCAMSPDASGPGLSDFGTRRVVPWLTSYCCVRNSGSDFHLQPDRGHAERADY